MSARIDSLTVRRWFWQRVVSEGEQNGVLARPTGRARSEQRKESMKAVRRSPVNGSTKNSFAYHVHDALRSVQKFANLENRSLLADDDKSYFRIDIASSERVTEEAAARVA